MKERERIVVLLSGGQDSTTCLFWAMNEYPGVEIFTVSFDYGQRHKCELDVAAGMTGYAQRVSNGTTVHHTVLPLEALSLLGGSSLVDHSEALTHDGGYEDQAALKGLPSSYVPGRNIMFLTLAAAFACQVGARKVVTGVCQTDYSGYPDCRHDFISAMQLALNRGMPSSANIELITPLMFRTKAETVKLMADLGPAAWVALGRTITCYDGIHGGCGKCAACELRQAGFEESGYTDPARSA